MSPISSRTAVPRPLLRSGRIAQRSDDGDGPRLRDLGIARDPRSELHGLPAFARDDAGGYRYHALSETDTRDKRSPFDFPHTGTREVEAEEAA